MLAARLALALLAGPTAAQQIRTIAKDARGQVSVACMLPGSSLNCDLEPRSHPPMQSVFKLPLALTTLHQIEKGKYSMEQLIRFRKQDLILPKPYSPLQDKYPNAEVDVTLRTLLRLTVSESDNTAADILWRLAGGSRPVEAYLATLGIRGFHLRDNERALHRCKALQYRNWFEPASAVRLLRLIAEHPPISRADDELLLSWMIPPVSTKRLQGDLPSGTVVAHKSGTSDVENGIAAATNDIGLITLPDGKKLAIAVFVTDSRAKQDVRERVIARIAKVVYDKAIQSDYR